MRTRDYSTLENVLNLILNQNEFANPLTCPASLNFAHNKPSFFTICSLHLGIDNPSLWWLLEDVAVVSGARNYRFDGFDVNCGSKALLWAKILAL